jgi:YbbR domain-containing protein
VKGKEPGLKGWLTSLGRHKGLKLLSLLLALALWFTVSGEERTETSLHMALEFVNLPAKMVITGEVPPDLQVRVIGPRSIVNKLSQSRLTQTIDLSAIKGGPHTFYLGPNSFSFPRGVVVTRIQPNPITINLSPTINATLTIKPMLAGSLPEGYELKGVKTRPDQVTVVGPSEELTVLKFIPTHPIDLRRLTEVTVVATDLDFKNLHLSLKNQVPILAELDIQPMTLTRTIPDVHVIPEPGPANLRPAQVAVTVQGPWPQVKELKPGEVKAAVDTSGLGRSRGRLNVSISLPQGVSLVRVQPGSVTGFLKKAP